MVQPGHDSTDDPGFAYRLRQAVKALELARGKDISQEELGAAVGKAMKREPFTGVAAHRWLKGRRPAYEVLAAMAEVLGVRKGWLAFGEGEAGEGVSADLIKKSVEAAAASKAELRRPHPAKGESPPRKRSDRAG